MIEVYLFLAMFPVQILAMSVLFPARFIRYARSVSEDISAERLAELYPGLDDDQAHERFLDSYRAANTVVAVLGLLVLGWLFSYMRQPDWSLGMVIALNSVYFVLQFLPLLLAAWFTYRLYKTHEHALSGASARRCWNAAGFSISSRRPSFSWPSWPICCLSRS